MFVAVGAVGINPHLPFAAEFRGDGFLFLNANKVVVAAAVGDQIADRADFQTVMLRECHQFRQARHGAVFVHDLADHARFFQTRKTRDVDSRFGMARTDQNAALLGAQREHVARRRNVLCAFRRIDGHRDGARAVSGGNTRGHAFARLDRHGERGFMTRRVVRGHQRQAQFLDPVACHRQADQTTTVGRHEVDGIGCGPLRRNNQIAFIFAIFMIDKNEHFAVACIFDDLFHTRDRIFPVLFDRAGLFVIDHDFSILVEKPDKPALPELPEIAWFGAA